MTIASPPFRFTNHQYHRLGEAGVLPPDARLELVHGEILTMSPIGPRHSLVTKTILGSWIHRIPYGWHLGIQDPVTLDEHNEPQPDISVIRGEPSNYLGRHPGPHDIGLIIEVAETSLEFDTGAKRALYASCGIVEYWVVDIPNQRIEVSTGPGPNGYASTVVLAPGQAACSITVEGLSLQVAEIFPPA